MRVDVKAPHTLVKGLAAFALALNALTACVQGHRVHEPPTSVIETLQDFTGSEEAPLSPEETQEASNSSSQQLDKPSRMIQLYITKLGRTRKDQHGVLWSIQPEHFGQLDREPLQAPTASPVVHRTSAGLLPGSLLLAVVQSRYESIRLPGWAVLFPGSAVLAYLLPWLIKLGSTFELDCYPHPFDVVAIYSVYQTIP